MSACFMLMATLAALGLGPTDAHFADKEDIADVAHMKQHLEDKIDVKTEWSPEERRFHYFSLNDHDNNGFIDGIEIIKAIMHHESGTAEHESDASSLPKIWTDDELETEVDNVLKDIDINGDGQIDYGEYSKRIEL